MKLAKAIREIVAQPMPLTDLTGEEKLFQSSVQQFAREQVAPLARDMDEKGQFRRELIDEFFRLGLMGIQVPEFLGGSGGSFFNSVLATEQLASVDPSAALIVETQNIAVNNALLRWATEDQKNCYLPSLAKDTVGAFAVSEAGSGSDAFSMSSVALDKGEFFLLRGRKLWITNAYEAGLFLVFANAQPEAGYRGITAFVVERNYPGFQIGKKEAKLGIRSSSTCELLLEDCRVPRKNVLGKIGEGYKILLETVNEGRIGIGAKMIGLAQGALDHAVQYAKERKQFGKPIADFQAIQFQLAEIATDIEAARLMVYNAARLHEEGRQFRKEDAMAKYFSSQVAERTASFAIEIFGGYGYTRDCPVEKLYRDAKIGKIYEGTSNIQLQSIAKIILGS